MREFAVRKLTERTLAILEIGLAAILCLTATGAAAGTTHASNNPMYGLAGTYALSNARDLQDLADHHFDLARLGGVPLPALARPLGIYEVNSDIGSLLYSQCLRYWRKSTACDPAVQDRENDAIAKRLKMIGANKNIVAFWVLDDNPGYDIRPELRTVHDLIQAQNAKDGANRPMICGFGGILDLVVDGKLRGYAVDFDAALKNYDARACDMVALYPYAVYGPNYNPKADPSIVDWSMSQLLPEMKAKLRALGWDEGTAPLIGVPQAFGGANPDLSGHGFVTPSASDVTTQTVAYCRGGAVALLAETSGYAPAAPQMTLFNTDSLMTGYQNGVNTCRNRFWSKAAH